MVDKTLFSDAHRCLHACGALRSLIASRCSRRFLGLEFPRSLGYPSQNICVSFCRSLPALSSSFWRVLSCHYLGGESGESGVAGRFLRLATAVMLVDSAQEVRLVFPRLGTENGLSCYTSQEEQNQMRCWLYLDINISVNELLCSCLSNVFLELSGFT